MTDGPKPDPFEAYGEGHSGPDATSTARLQGRLNEYMAARKQQRRLQLARRVAIVAVLGLGAGAGILFWPAEQDAVEVVADELDQSVSLPGGGALVALHPGRVRVLSQGDDGVLLELVFGTAKLTVPSDAKGRWRIRSGPYEVEATDATFTVRHTGEAPQVTVEHGVARVTGPKLPPEGLVIEPG